MEELREEIQRKSSKRGYKDISQLDFPVEGEEEMSEEEEEPPAQRRRTEEERAEEAEGEAEAEPQAEGGTGNETTSGESSSSSSSSDSKQMDSAIRSVVHNENLDGTPVRRDSTAAEPYGPTRERLEQMRFKPYNFFVIQEGEELKQGDEETSKVGEHEEWIFCEERRSLIRRHGEYRKGSFVPIERRGAPIDPKFLQSQCRVTQYFLDGKTEVKKVNWRKKEDSEIGPLRYWIGETEFSIKPPGEAPSRKSRWCIRGDKDPDLMLLERYAPTVTTAVIAMALQVAATKGFRCALGDLKNAFMQSDPLFRQRGRLYCKQLAGGPRPTLLQAAGWRSFQPPPTAVDRDPGGCI